MSVMFKVQNINRSWNNIKSLEFSLNGAELSLNSVNDKYFCTQFSETFRKNSIDTFKHSMSIWPWNVMTSQGHSEGHYSPILSMSIWPWNVMTSQGHSEGHYSPILSMSAVASTMALTVGFLAPCLSIAPTYRGWHVSGAGRSVRFLSAA